MPRYELAGDTWQIEQTDEQLAITSAGKTTIRKFRTPEQAAVQLVKLVDERVAAGYLPTLEPRHAALEAAIASDPDDPIAYAVYADWLQSQGDPRGAMIAHQLAAAATGDAKLAASFAKELARHAAYLLGPLARIAGELQWRFGFIRRASLSVEHHAPIDEMLETLLRHPSARFLFELLLVGHDRMQQAVAIAERLAPASLRTLRLLSVDHLDATSLTASLVQLRRLSMSGRGLVLGELALPALEILQVSDTAPTAATSRALARAELPALRELSLDFGDAFHSGDASIDDIFEMMQRPAFPALSSLALRNTRYSREVILELATSPWAAQLTSLDLAYNHMTDAHALSLVGHRAKFPRLAHLEVSYNELSDASLSALTALCPDVRSQRQNVALARR